MLRFVVKFFFWFLVAVVAILGFPFALIGAVVANIISYFTSVYEESLKVYNKQIKNNGNGESL